MAQYILRPPSNYAALAAIVFCCWCFDLLSFFLFFSSFCRLVSEVATSIVSKLFHMFEGQTFWKTHSLKYLAAQKHQHFGDLETCHLPKAPVMPYHWITDSLVFAFRNILENWNGIVRIISSSSTRDNKEYWTNKSKYLQWVKFSRSLVKFLVITRRCLSRN